MPNFVTVGSGISEFWYPDFAILRRLNWSLLPCNTACNTCHHGVYACLNGSKYQSLHLRFVPLSAMTWCSTGLYAALFLLYIAHGQGVSLSVHSRLRRYTVLHELICQWRADHCCSTSAVRWRHWSLYVVKPPEVERWQSTVVWLCPSPQLNKIGNVRLSDAGVDVSLLDRVRNLGVTPNPLLTVKQQHADKKFARSCFSTFYQMRQLYVRFDDHLLSTRYILLSSAMCLLRASWTIATRSCTAFQLTSISACKCYWMPLHASSLVVCRRL